MSSPLCEAVSEIQAIHSRVQSLLDAATEQRLYAEIAALARIAQSLSTLLGQITVDVPPHLPSNQQTLPKRARADEESEVLDDDCQEYPRFLVQDDCLVKIAWSSSKSAPYEHRAPLAVLRTIVERAIALNGRNQNPFTAEALSDVGLQDDGQEVRGYQLYLCLGWLRREKLIRQYGRRGYRIVRTEEPLLDSVERTLRVLSAKSRERE